MTTAFIRILRLIPHLAAPAAHINNTHLRVLLEIKHVKCDIMVSAGNFWAVHAMLHVPH
jgi:hypothetical protein